MKFLQIKKHPEILRNEIASNGIQIAFLRIGIVLFPTKIITGVIILETKRPRMDPLTKFFAIIGLITSFILIIGLLLLILKSTSSPRVHSKTVLEIDIGMGLIETRPDALIYQLTRGEQLQIRNIVTLLEAAGKDRKIKGIVARIAGAPINYADAQEIRDAVQRFRTTGKTAIAYAETFGETGPGNSSYYLATAFDSIFLMPSGDLGLTGILSQSPFFKGTLEKIDVDPQLAARKEYKTALNQFTEGNYTQQHREMSQAIVNSVLNIFLSDIATSRKIDKIKVSNLVSQGPFTADQALAAGLVDGLQYRDQVYDNLKNKYGKNTHFLCISNYAKRSRAVKRGRKAIALIYGEGAIVQGKSSYNPLSGEVTMGAQTIASAFRAAIKDKTIGAIVFRVNSPGGSHIASEVIWRETVLAKKAGKPVVVSMGAVAGSGGYYVSMNADKIIAHPSTITGSIGVVGGKFVTQGLYNKLGVTFDHVSTSPNATIWSSINSYSEEQWNYLQQNLDTVYNDFVSKVASGRNIPIDKVKNIAKGRIYTGAQALELGLVDTLGGFYEAFTSAKMLMGIPATSSIPVKIFPKKRSIWKRVFSEGADSSEEVELTQLFNNPYSTQILSQAIQSMRKPGLLSMNKVNLY